jgi:comEA protein
MKKKISLISLIWSLSIGSIILAWASNPAHNQLIMNFADSTNVIILNSCDTVTLQRYIHTPNSMSNNCINLNNASIEELDALPGIGVALADRIIQFRQENGAFEKIDDLKKVKGIGTAKIAQIKQKICL